MTKVEFLQAWAKRATAGGAVENFERDVESLMATTIRATTRGIALGLKEAAFHSPSAMQEKILRDVAATVIPAVEGAMMKANGIGVEEEGDSHASGNTEGPSRR